MRGAELYDLTAQHDGHTVRDLMNYRHIMGDNHAG